MLSWGRWWLGCVPVLCREVLSSKMKNLKVYGISSVAKVIADRNPHEVLSEKRNVHLQAPNETLFRKRVECVLGFLNAAWWLRRSRLDLSRGAFLAVGVVYSFYDPAKNSPGY